MGVTNVGEVVVGITVPVPLSVYSTTKSTSSTADFQGALATDAAATLRMALPAALGGRSRWRGLTILSAQNLDWDVFLFKTSNAYNIPPGGTVDNVYLAGHYRFFASDGVQIADTGPWMYYIDGMDIPYHDLDSANAQQQPNPNVAPLGNPPFINLVLVNRNAVAKSAGAAGYVQMRLAMEATNG